MDARTHTPPSQNERSALRNATNARTHTQPSPKKQKKRFLSFHNAAPRPNLLERAEQEEGGVLQAVVAPLGVGLFLVRGQHRLRVRQQPGLGLWLGFVCLVEFGVEWGWGVVCGRWFGGVFGRCRG